MINRSRLHLSELERTIREIVLETLNLKITDRGLRINTSVEQINQGIKEMTKQVAEMLQKERLKATTINVKSRKYNAVRGYKKYVR